MVGAIKGSAAVGSSDGCCNAIRSSGIDSVEEGTSPDTAGVGSVCDSAVDPRVG
jgi:hypothetical protein